MDGRGGDKSRPLRNDHQALARHRIPAH